MFMQKSLLKNNIRKWTADYWSKVEIRSNGATTTLAVATLQKRRISRRSDANTLDTTPTTTALIIGSTGALGSTIASYLHEHQRDANIIGVDFVIPPLQNKKCLNHFIPLTDRTRTLNSPTTLADLTDQIKSGLETYDNGHPNAIFDVIICTAGGFIPTVDYSDPNDFINGVENMLRQNLYPVIAASHIAATRLKPGGLFVCCGAASALGPTPGMLAYGISKNAVHHVIQTLGGLKGELIRSSEIQPTVVALLPVMLDTSANRANSPEGTDYSQWIKTEDIAKELCQWISIPDLRPNSGSLVKVFTHNKSGKAIFRLVR